MLTAPNQPIARVLLANQYKQEQLLLTEAKCLWRYQRRVEQLRHLLDSAAVYIYK